MIAKNATRVSQHTAPEVNERIESRARRRIARYASAPPEELSERLDELDREWDIERALETQASSLMLAGVALAALKDRRWLALPAVVSAFLLQHAVQGWCPPVPALRRLGFRTAREIEDERKALLDLIGARPGTA